MRKLSSFVLLTILSASLISCIPSKKSRFRENPEIRKGVTIVDGDREAHLVKLNFSTKDHTAVMVPVYAFGPGAERFSGIYENTEIFQKILTSFGFDQIK